MISRFWFKLEGKGRDCWCHFLSWGRWGGIGSWEHCFGCGRYEILISYPGAVIRSALGHVRSEFRMEILVWGLSEVNCESTGLVGKRAQDGMGRSRHRAPGVSTVRGLKTGFINVDEGQLLPCSWEVEVILFDGFYFFSEVINWEWAEVGGRNVGDLGRSERVE